MTWFGVGLIIGLVLGIVIEASRDDEGYWP